MAICSKTDRADCRCAPTPPTATAIGWVGKNWKTENVMKHSILQSPPPHSVASCEKPFGITILLVFRDLTAYGIQRSNCINAQHSTNLLLSLSVVTILLIDSSNQLPCVSIVQLPICLCVWTCPVAQYPRLKYCLHIMRHIWLLPFPAYLVTIPYQLVNQSATKKSRDT